MTTTRNRIIADHFDQQKRFRQLQRKKLKKICILYCRHELELVSNQELFDKNGRDLEYLGKIFDAFDEYLKHPELF